MSANILSDKEMSHYLARVAAFLDDPVYADDREELDALRAETTARYEAYTKAWESGESALRARHERNYPRCERVCERIIGCIQSTGGVKHDDHGHTVPACDEDWIYLAACEAIGQDPVYADSEEE